MRRRPLGWLRITLRLPLAIVLLLGGLLTVFTVFPFVDTSRRARIASGWSRWLLRCCGIRLREVIDARARAGVAGAGRPAGSMAAADTPAVEASIVEASVVDVLVGASPVGVSSVSVSSVSVSSISTSSVSTSSVSTSSVSTSSVSTSSVTAFAAGESSIGTFPAGMSSAGMSSAGMSSAGAHAVDDLAGGVSSGGVSPGSVRPNGGQAADADRSANPGPASPLGCMLVANHVSWLDILLVQASTPASFVAKAEIRRWPLIGWLVAGSGTLFIERHRRHAIHDVNRHIERTLREGRRVAVFPEGTTGAGDRLLPFHGNLIQAALRAQAPIVPVGIRYLDRHGNMPEAVRFIGDTTFVISFFRVLGEPTVIAEAHYLPPVGGATRQAVAAHARQAIAERLRLPFDDELPQVVRALRARG